MLASLTGMLLGIVLGMRHALEPDHLTAVGTLVTEARGARRGALLGMMWGLGHTASLVLVGGVLVATGAALPARAAASFELLVAIMLVVLGARALWRAAARPAPSHVHPHPHPHGRVDHVHAFGRAIALRPLAVGLVHGLAGTGAITALVFAEMPTMGARLAYIAMFGAGSVAGMAIMSGLAGASLTRVAGGGARWLTVAAGVLSIVVGIVWSFGPIAAL